MTPEERAEKIHPKWCPCVEGKECGVLFDIATQISEAVQEVVEKELHARMSTLRDTKAYAEGFASAREKAAGIAQRHDELQPHYDEGSSAEHLCMRCGMTIAERIRGMSQEAGK